MWWRVHGACVKSCKYVVVWEWIGVATPVVTRPASAG